MIKKILKKTFVYRLYQEHKFNTESNQYIKQSELIRKPLLEKYLPQNSIGAELGVLKGEFSRILLEATKAKELHLIDPWYFLDSEWSWAGGNTSTVDAVINILKRFKNEINNRRVFVHIEDDIKVLGNFPDNYFDWAYLDSSHAYEHTVKELALLKFKVKESGIICGDDWRPDKNHRHHGVYKAVLEFVKNNNYQVIYADDKNLQWFIKKTDS